MADKTIIGGSFDLDVEGVLSGIQSLKKHLRSLDKEFYANTAGMDNWAKSTEGLNLRVEYLNKKLQDQQKILEAQVKRLEDAKKAGTASADALQRMADQINEAKTAVGRTEVQIRKYEKALKDVSDGTSATIKSTKDMSRGFTVMKGVVANLATLLTEKLGRALVDGAKASVQAFTTYESAFTGVEKTVDGTETEISLLDARIRSMSRKTLPVATEQLAKVAEVGGQLGIAVDGLTDFVRVMTELGDATDLSAEEAGTLIAQLGTITGLSSAEYERFGSTLVDLGNSFATTESHILNMATRLASTLTLVGASESDILALSAVMSSLGLEAEAGGTAVSKLFQKFQIATATGKNLDKLATLVGKTSQEFRALFEKDAVGALQAFLQALNEVQTEGGSTITVLQDMGITETRMIDAVQRLSLAAGDLPAAIDQANTAWKKNTALANEAAKRYDDFAQKMQLAKNSISELGRTVGGLIVPIIGDMADLLNSVIDIFATSKSDIDRYAGAIDDATQAMKDFNDVSSEMGDSSAEAVRGKSLTAISSAFKDMATSIGEASNEAKKYEGNINRLQNADLGKYVEIMEEGQKGSYKVFDTQEELNQAVAEQTSNYDAAIERRAEYIEQTKKFVTSMVETLNLTEAQRETLQQLNPVLSQMYEEERRRQEVRTRNEEYEKRLQSELTGIRADATAIAEADAKTITDSTAGLEKQKAIIQSRIKYLQDELALKNADAGILDEDSEKYNRIIAALEVYRKTETEINNEISNRNKLLAKEAEGFTLGSLTSELTLYGQKQAKLDDINKKIAHNNELLEHASETQREQIDLANTLLQKKADQITAEREAAQANLVAYTEGAGTIEEQYKRLQQVIADYGSGALPSIGKEALASLNEDLEELRRQSITAGERMAEDIAAGFAKIDASKFSKSFAGFMSAMQELKDRVGPVVKSMVDGITEIFNAGQQEELATVEANYKERQRIQEKALKQSKDAETDQKKALDERLRAGQISQLEYYQGIQKAEDDAESRRRQIEAQKEADEEQYRQKRQEIEQKAFDADKANKISQIWMSYAQAVMTAYGQLGLVWGSVAAGTLGIIAGAQTATVAKQKYVPAFAHGGMPEKGQIFQANEDGKEVMTSYKGRPVVMPLQKHTEWIDELADRLNIKIQAGQTMNTTNDDHHVAYNINQTIQSRPMTKREIYMQTRRALKTGGR